MSRPKRHPAEVTADRLRDHIERDGHRMCGSDLIALENAIAVMDELAAGGARMEAWFNLAATYERAKLGNSITPQTEQALQQMVTFLMQPAQCYTPVVRREDSDTARLQAELDNVREHRDSLLRILKDSERTVREGQQHHDRLAGEIESLESENKTLRWVVHIAWDAADTFGARIESGAFRALRQAAEDYPYHGAGDQ